MDADTIRVTEFAPDGPLLSEGVDDFAAVYLHVNESACGDPDSSTLGASRVAGTVRLIQPCEFDCGR